MSVFVVVFHTSEQQWTRVEWSRVLKNYVNLNPIYKNKNSTWHSWQTVLKKFRIWCGSSLVIRLDAGLYSNHLIMRAWYFIVSFCWLMMPLEQFTIFILTYRRQESIIIYLQILEMLYLFANWFFKNYYSNHLKIDIF